MIREHRLIGLLASQFNDPLKYNTRIAEANSAQQQATRDAALNSVTRESYGNEVPTNVAPSSMGAVSNSFEPTPTGTSTNYQVSTPTQGTAGLMSEARTVYGAQPGQKTVYDNTTKTTVNIPDGQIALSAYNRLVGSGLTAQQAADKLNDPSYKQGIAEASNTYGTKIPGYTDPSSLTPDGASGRTGMESNAQFEQRKAAVTTQNTELMKQEQIKGEVKEGQKNKLPKVELHTEQVKKKIDELDSLLETLSPDVKAAAGFEIMTLRNQAANVDSQVQEITDTYQSDSEIEGEFVDDKARADTTEKRFLDLADKNLKTMKEVAEYNRDMLEIDKKIMEQRAAEDEAKQVKANIQNERKLRRQLNALGIETDTSGLDFLNDSIQDGQDALAGLRSANSLNSLKANLAIGEGYRLEVQKALDGHEGQYLNITNQTQEKLDAISNSIAQAKSERQKGIREALKWGAEQKSILEQKTGQLITQANYRMMEEKAKAREDLIIKEDRALDRIDYLLKHYPRESVSEAIKELGKDVTSFNVQTLIDNPTLTELAKAKAAVTARTSGGYSSSFLPAGLREPPKPAVSLQDFMQNKLSSLESEASQSFTLAKRAELIAKNSEKWEKEHEAIYMSGSTGAAVGQAKSDLVQQFGQVVVDAAQLVMDGTYTGTDPVGKAAKAMHVPAAQVATALTKLKQTGAVSNTAILSPAQQKSRDTIIGGLKTDPFYTVWNGSKSAVTRINAAIGDNGGATGLSDIMAINAFQNGIVDPGSTVKEGDVSLMQTAIAWADLVQLDYWKEKISDGDKLPASMRQKMLQLATATRDAYGRDFQAETVPRVRSLIQQNGLPSTVLDTHLGTSKATTVSAEVQAFADSYFSQ